MDLKRKLSRLGPPGPVRNEPATSLTPASASDVIAPPPTAQPTPHPRPSPPEGRGEERLRRQIGALSERVRLPASVRAEVRTASASAPGELPAEPRDTAYGRIHVREHVLPPGHRHGLAEVRAALEADPADVAALALDEGLASVDLTRMLLLDTETTGLAGGTGTLPFVVGLAWFDGDALRVQQLLLRRPGEEGPILRHLEERLAASSCLVTYNGKTFDWPLLKSRFVMNRLPVPPALPHLDLLHCARRVFRHRSGGAKLVHLEEHVLGHVRVGDVPGGDIPELYFRYLRNGNGSLLTPVLEHNAQDMALLPALLGVIARQFRASGREGDPRDQLGYAQVATRARDYDRALAFARAAASSGGSALSAEALALASTLSRRNGESQEAINLLERALGLAGRDAAPALHLELSKLYEHRARDPGRALQHARHTASAEGADAQARRLARLERKLSRRDGTLPLLTR